MTLLLAIVASSRVAPLQRSSRSGRAVITSRPFALHVFFGRYFFLLISLCALGMRKRRKKGTKNFNCS
jgi:hypothetical protein